MFAVNTHRTFLSLSFPLSLSPLFLCSSLSLLSRSLSLSLHFSLPLSLSLFFSLSQQASVPGDLRDSVLPLRHLSVSLFVTVTSSGCTCCPQYLCSRLATNGPLFGIKTHLPTFLFLSFFLSFLSFFLSFLLSFFLHWSHPASLLLCSRLATYGILFGVKAHPFFGKTILHTSTTSDKSGGTPKHNKTRSDPSGKELYYHNCTTSPEAVRDEVSGDNWWRRWAG